MLDAPHPLFPSLPRSVACPLALILLLACSSGCGGSAPTDAPADEPSSRMEYALAVHGGALGSLDSLGAERQARYEAALSEALSIGEEILAGGGSSVDSVEAVVRHLEDHPLFNAGRGAVYTHDGRHTLDASIMDGRDLSCGAVAGVTRIRNPILLARRVMTESPHVLLAGEGAEAFAAEQGLGFVEPAHFDTERRREQWEEWKREQEAGAAADHGTVGAVALDADGHLAAATSTGGITGKRYGRIGDSPIVGAGTFADDRSCAVSCTGQGEEFIRHGVARRISALMRYRDLSVAEAARRVVHDVLSPGDGGIIAVSSTGEIAMEFSTGGMLRARADSSGRREVLVR
jgi:beta-aspartyl-peptidase (threonine type)